MPYFKFSCKLETEDSFIEDMLRNKSQHGAASALSSSINDESRSTSSRPDVINNEDHRHYLSDLKSKYEKLPNNLKNCFEYCCTCVRSSTEKSKLARLLLAEGLVEEKSGEIMEDTAKNIIAELVAIGLLQEQESGNTIKIPNLCRLLSLIIVEKQEFVANAANCPLRLWILHDGTREINTSLKKLIIRSLFIRTVEYSGSCKISRASMERICGFQFLLVIDLDGQVEFLPDEIGILVHLRYLGLENSDLNDLPQSLGNLQKIQTLDIRMCGNLHKLPTAVLNIRPLRHLLMSRSIGDCEIIVPREIGMLTNLHTLTGVYAGNGIASELSSLTELRELGVKRVSEDQARDLYAAIRNMENLECLSLEAEEVYNEDECFSLLPELELFSPPPQLQDLYFHGGLVEMPNWLASMSNLKRLSLSHCYLDEDPTSILQFLPRLEHLSLSNAYKGTQIGKEFCQQGGFRELKTLTIHSDFLVEWTAIEAGAFPKLKSLSIRNCLELRFLPEGLQNISTLEELELIPMHEDLGWRLNNEDNCKIQHIKQLSACYRDQYPIIFVGKPYDVLSRA